VFKNNLRFLWAWTLDTIEYFFWSIARVLGPTWTSYQYHFALNTALQIVFSDISLMFICKFLQVKYFVDNFLLIYSFGCLMPFFWFAYKVVFSLRCPKSAGLISHFLVICSIVGIGLICHIAYNNAFITYSMVAAVAPFFTLSFTMSLMHFHTRRRVQFAATRDLPLLGVSSVVGFSFVLLGLKRLSFIDATVLLMLDGSWAAIFASVLLGNERRKLHYSFMKSYVLLICLAVFYLYGEVNPPPWQSAAMFVGGRMMLIFRSIYVKYSYARFNLTPEVVTPATSGPNHVLLSNHMKEPRMNRFEKFPKPALNFLDVIFDSGLYDDVLHAAGTFGTNDLNKLTDWAYALPIASLMCFTLEFERLPFGIMPPYCGHIGGDPQSPILQEEIAKEFLKFDGYLGKSGCLELTAHPLVCIILVATFMVIRLVLPTVTTRGIFHRGSSYHAQPMKPMIMIAPFFIYAVVYLHETPRFKLSLVLMMAFIWASFRRGLYLFHRRKVALLQTAQLRYCNPSVMRHVQKVTLAAFVDETSTEDYSHMLLETTVSKGEYIRSLGRKTGTEVWDPRPSALAAWKLSVSLVRKGIRKQKHDELNKLKTKVNVVMSIAEWVYQMSDDAVNNASGHGGRMRLCSIYATQTAKQRTFKTFKKMIVQKRMLRDMRQRGMLSSAPIIISTAGGVLRSLDQVTYPPQMKRPSDRTNGVFSLWKCVQDGSLPSPLSIVYCFGDRQYGQLGVIIRAGLVMSLDGFRGKDLVQVEAGTAASMAITATGKCWGFGSNRSLNLGMRKEITQVDVPARVKSLRDLDLVQVSCAKSGHAHCLALTQKGEVYSFGTSHCGALGVGDITQTSPIRLELTEKIAIHQVAAGVKHSILVTQQGALYAFGENSQGQLGIGRRKENDRRWITPFRNTPQLITKLTNVKSVVAGDCHNAAIANDRLYTWGANSDGQLGLSSVADEFEPTDTGLTNIESVACGSNHTLIVSNGRLWACGSNSHMQLGLESDIRTTSHPTLVTSIKNPVQTVVAAADHSFFIDSAHFLWAFGCNDEGQLSWDPAERKVVEKPEIIPELKISKVYLASTSPMHTIVLCTSRK